MVDEAAESEVTLSMEMHFDRKMMPSAIARTLGRDLSCICRLLAQKKAPRPIGQPRKLTEAMIDKTIKVLEKMVDEADAESEVTLSMVMRRCRLKVCERTVATALHKRGYWFHRLRNKKIVTPEDVASSFAWSKKYKDKPKEWFLTKSQIHLDNKRFKVALIVYMC